MVTSTANRAAREANSSSSWLSNVHITDL